MLCAVQGRSATCPECCARCGAAAFKLASEACLPAFLPQWDALREAAKPAAQALALVGVCFAAHACGLVVRLAGSLLLALAMALGGYRKGSLNPSGEPASWQRPLEALLEIHSFCF